MADDSCGPTKPAAPSMPAKPGARTVHCVKFDKDMPGLERIPWKGDIGKARVRKCFAGSLEIVDRALKNADERIPLESARPAVAKNHGRTDGGVFLGQGAKLPEGIRSAEGQGLAALSCSTAEACAAKTSPPISSPRLASGEVPVTGCSTGNRSAISNFRSCARGEARFPLRPAIFPAQK